ncbi:MAG TPA: aminoglycoside phosphotransferase family protein [Streptosporangiaceae bacterium]|nr:aminoglycoside phosphotransferase family protein [Streptosporangiaceae bacterium]
MALLAGVLHDDEIPIDTTLVRALVDRAMPDCRHLPVRQLDASGSSNALFRLGEDFLVRLPRQPGGSATIAKEARWLPVLAPSLPVQIPEVIAVFEPDCGYPEHWSVVRWIEGAHPEVVTPETSADPRRSNLAADLAEVINALKGADVPADAVSDPSLRWYRGEPLAAIDAETRQNIQRCRALGDFGFDLDAAEQLWDQAIELPGASDRPAPRWYHGDLAAENLLMRNGANGADRANGADGGDGHLAAILDFGGLAIGDPAVDLIVAWEVLDRPAREVFRDKLAVDDPTWLRGRAWALGITLMIWYYWTTMPQRRASRIAIGRNILADAWPA